MDTCLTVTLLHDYCTQTYINLHKLFTLYCNFICVLSVVIIKTDDDDDDECCALPLTKARTSDVNVMWKCDLLQCSEALCSGVHPTVELAGGLAPLEYYSRILHYCTLHSSENKNFTFITDFPGFLNNNSLFSFPHIVVRHKCLFGKKITRCKWNKSNCLPWCHMPETKWMQSLTLIQKPVGLQREQMCPLEKCTKNFAQHTLAVLLDAAGDSRGCQQKLNRFRGWKFHDLTTEPLLHLF